MVRSCLLHLLSQPSFLGTRIIAHSSANLCQPGALSVENLKRIVVDASHIDQKKRGVMDMKETMVPLVKWLARKEFKERYTEEKNPVDLLFY